MTEREDMAPATTRTGGGKGAGRWMGNLLSLFVLASTASIVAQTSLVREMQSAAVAGCADLGGAMGDRAPIVGTNGPGAHAKDVSVSAAKIGAAPRRLPPTCRPHWSVGARVAEKTTASGGDGRTVDDRPETETSNDALPITRIYFYHFRKAAGSTIHRYLGRVAKHYDLNYQADEWIHASFREEVGSRNDTLYVTNIRDPVGRSLSNFKYNQRWDCRSQILNASFVPTAENARPVETWAETNGFAPSPCNKPFRFLNCAMNCHIQAFSGEGCTSDGWVTEYRAAWDRLQRYNLIIVFEKLMDPDYVAAIEGFFGVKRMRIDNVDAGRMFCGPESKEFNKRIPLNMTEGQSRKLATLNEMDNRLYSDLVTPCWGGDEESEGGEGGAKKYAFPEVDAGRLIGQGNRTSCRGKECK